MKGQTNAWVESIISGEKLYITLTTNQSDHSDLLGAVITILIDNDVVEYIWDGNTIEYVIPTSKHYKVSFSTVEGYTTPEFFEGNAVNGNVHEVLGVYNTEMLTVNVNDVSGYEISISKKVKGIVDSIIPERYTQLEYIEGTGTQYIDTEFKPNNNTRVVIDLELPELSSYPKVLFGGRDGKSTSDKSYILWAISATSFRSDFNTNTINIPITPTGRFTIDKNKTIVTINGVEYTNNASTFLSNYNLGICTEFDSDGPDERIMSGKIYSCKIYNNDSLIRDYIPALSNGVAGLFDKVNNKFYPSASTTDFLAGPITEYTPLEYIESTGKQYIDTGFKPNQDTRIVIKSKCPITNSNNWLFGARTSTSSSKFAFLGHGNGYYQSQFGEVNKALGTQYNKDDVFVLEQDKNNIYIDGVLAVTHTETTFQAPVNLFLLAVNTNGTITYSSSNIQLYSCQIYDNNILIRDYIPVKNLEGVAGLYDKVNNKFYSSATSTAFVAGEEVHETIAIQTTSTMSYKIPFETEYIISASDIIGYNTPSNQSFIASQPTRNVDMVYEKEEFGVLIYDIDEKLTYPDDWNTANNSKAVGVAILTDKCRFVVAKSDIGTKGWGGYNTDVVTLVNYKDEANAATDFNGINNTSKIIEALGWDNAPGDCAVYTFPNGKTGYLGSAGEWLAASQNKDALNSALTLIGGTKMTQSPYWTSTEYSNNTAWRHLFGSNSIFTGAKSIEVYVRAFLPC